MDYELKISQQDIQIIIAALGELPLKVASGAYSRLQSQVMLQDSKNAIDLKDLVAK